MSVAVTDIDKGWRLARDAFGKGATVRCGIQGSDAVRQHSDESRATIVEIATTHEFGSSDGRVPQRSFLRSTFDEKQHELSGLLERVGRLVATTKMTPKQAVEVIGLRYIDLVKAKIRGKIMPRLSRYTLSKRLKKIWADANTKKRRVRAQELQTQFDKSGSMPDDSVTPLIDTGRLIGSLRAVVKVGSK